jgi:hypothetical protein
VLHHVSLEVAPDEVERTVEFFKLLGFSTSAGIWPERTHGVCSAL